MGRKIPGRKHRGIRDPEKQAAVRFESIKYKINAPPSNADNQDLPKSLQRIIDLKNKVKSGDFFKKKPKNEKIEYNDSRKQERPARDFIQFPGETDREFVHRVNKICTHVVKEAEFEERYGVEIKRNENGEIEGVVKRQKDELELLLKKAKKKSKEEQKGKKKKKKKEKEGAVRLSKWQKRKKKLNDKKERKEMENVDEFKQYKDEVKFGEIAHVPPSLVAPRRVEKHETVPRPGKKNLLLKTLIESTNKKSSSTVNMEHKNNLNKTRDKAINKTGKRKELPTSLRRQLDQQQKEIISAYKELKAKKYK